MPKVTRYGHRTPHGRARSACWGNGPRGPACCASGHVVQFRCAGPLAKQSGAAPTLANHFLHSTGDVASRGSCRGMVVVEGVGGVASRPVRRPRVWARPAGSLRHHPELNPGSHGTQIDRLLHACCTGPDFSLDWRPRALSPMEAAATECSAGAVERLDSFTA